MWQGAEYIAKKTESNFFAFAEDARTFPSINYYRIDNKETLLETHKIFKFLENEISSRAKNGDVIFINLRYPYHFGGNWYEFPVELFRYFDENNKVIIRDTKKIYFEKWLKSLGEYAKELSNKNVKLVISTPTPEFPKAVNKECREQNLQWFNRLNKKDCNTKLEFFTSQKGKYFYIIKRLKSLSSLHPNLYLFDALNEMCPLSKCNYSIDKEILYRDDDHISNYSSRYIIAPKMINFLKENRIVESK